MKEDNGTKRKLSKRKDPELSLDYYRGEGYYPVAVVKYLMTILNSNFEEWERKNPSADYTQFKFTIEKMGRSGALFDLDKLNDISKTELSKLSAEEMYAFHNSWVQEFGSEADRAHFADSNYIISILNLIMGIGGQTRRKANERAKPGGALLAYFFAGALAPVYG